MAAVVSFTTAFVLLLVLVVASPLLPTASAARNPLHFAEDRVKSPDNISIELQKTLNTLSSLLTQLINPRGGCNLEKNTVRLINEVVKSVKKLGSLLCDNQGSVSDIVIPYVVELQFVVSQFKPLMKSLPTDSVHTVAHTIATMDNQIASYVPSMIDNLHIHI